MEQIPPRLSCEAVVAELWTGHKWSLRMTIGPDNSLCCEAQADGKAQVIQGETGRMNMWLGPPSSYRHVVPSPTHSTLHG